MEKIKVLLIDDDKNIRQTLQATLKSLEYQVIACATAQEGLESMKSGHFDFILTDFRLDSGHTGIEMIKAAKQLQSHAVVVVMTAFASFENAVTAIKEGAYDYLPKPFTNDQLEHLLKKVEKIVSLQKENEHLKRGVNRSDYFTGMTSVAMARLEEFTKKVASTEAAVLLTGESGTGKTELGQYIHKLSPRAKKLFVVVNCTSLAESLMEAELFGHVKGAFTGAIQNRTGKLEEANGGTLFLDEIGDLPLSGQAKLLRFLQEKVIERVGSNKAIEIDARVIAATNKNLVEAVKSGQFREDLYYRLNVFECNIVALRFRKEDLPVLIEKFLREFSSSAHHEKTLALTPELNQKLLDYSWPGNIRELRNVIERLVFLASSNGALRSEDLPESIQRAGMATSVASETSLKSLEEVERDHIAKILAVENNMEKAAHILGITTVTLWRKRKEYGLP